MKDQKRTIMIPTVVVFLAVLTVVAISFLMSQGGMRREVDDRMLDYAKTTEGDIIDRVKIFEETLWAGSGLFSGNTNVTKHEWTQFIATSAVMKRYPGARGVGYIKVVHDSNAKKIRSWSENTLPSNFKIYPEGVRATYTPVLYFEPQLEEGRSIVGFDTQTDEPRRQAIERARDTGQMAMSDVVESIVDPGTDTRGFILYIPQYKTGMPTSNQEERRAAIEGYVYAAFRAQTFMENVISIEPNEAIAFNITNVNSGQELYKTSNYDEVVTKQHNWRTSEIEIGGNKLKFNYEYNEAGVLDESPLSSPLAILVYGIITALLIATAVWLILRGKANELLLAQERDINEAKDNLLSLASHQLRTPATGVKQYIGLLMQGYAGGLTQQQQGLLEKAYSSNERQLKTINDILYMARLGSGRVILSKSNFSVQQLVNDIIDELHEEIAKKQHIVKKRISIRRKYFYGDEHMIRMVVENLLNNAIKYTHEGGEITVSASHGKELVISVSDNGVGIPLDQQSRMFKQFERIENDLSIAVGGSGIGLYVVQNIAELHGGKIEVTSDGVTGATFTLRLPSQRRVSRQK